NGVTYLLPYHQIISLELDVAHDPHPVLAPDRKQPRHNLIHDRRQRDGHVFVTLDPRQSQITNRHHPSPGYSGCGARTYLLSSMWSSSSSSGICANPSFRRYSKACVMASARSSCWPLGNSASSVITFSAQSLKR